MMLLYTVLVKHIVAERHSIIRHSLVGQLAARPFGSLLHRPRPFAHSSIPIYTLRRQVEGMQ